MRYPMSPLLRGQVQRPGTLGRLIVSKVYEVSRRYPTSPQLRGPGSKAQHVWLPPWETIRTPARPILVWPDALLHAYSTLVVELNVGMHHLTSCKSDPVHPENTRLRKCQTHHGPEGAVLAVRCERPPVRFVARSASIRLSGRGCGT